MTTLTFATSSYHHPPLLSPLSVLGICLGFSILGILIIIVIVNTIREQFIERRKTLDQKLEIARQRLQSMGYNILVLDKEFMEKFRKNPEVKGLSF